VLVVVEVVQVALLRPLAQAVVGMVQLMRQIHLLELALRTLVVVVVVVIVRKFIMELLVVLVL
jgi:hypothetical protein